MINLAKKIRISTIFILSLLALGQLSFGETLASTNRYGKKNRKKSIVKKKQTVTKVVGIVFFVGVCVIFISTRGFKGDVETKGNPHEQSLLTIKDEKVTFCV